MAEYIDREALLEKRWDVPFETEDSHFVQVVDVGDIIAAPAADVAPVRHGRWIYHEEIIHTLSHTRCSVCSSIRYEHYVNDFRYCPSCGSKMDGGGDG